jgi:hypothetical protein
MKYLKVFIISAIVIGLGFAATPQPAHAFTLFGIKFFEKSTPTPTPTPKPTVTPTPTPTPILTATPTVAGVTTNGNLPSTGPEQSIGALLLAVVGGFVARKYWQVTHQV